MNLTEITQTLKEADDLRRERNVDPRRLDIMNTKLFVIAQHLLRQRTAAPPIITPRDAAYRSLTETTAREYERHATPKFLQSLLPNRLLRAWVAHKTRRKHLRYVKGMMQDIRRWRA